MHAKSRSFRFAARRIRGQHFAAAVLLAFVVETAAAETLSSGPMPVANLTPFVQTRLEAGVPRPVRGRIGEWSLDTTLSYGNTYIMSDNVRSYLEVRNERRAIDADDLAAFAATGQDYLDVNVTRMTFETTVRLTSRVAGFVRLPIIHSGGGHVDSLIEGFHDARETTDLRRDADALSTTQTDSRLGGFLDRSAAVREAIPQQFPQCARDSPGLHRQYTRIPGTQTGESRCAPRHAAECGLRSDSSPAGSAQMVHPCVKSRPHGQIRISPDGRSSCGKCTRAACRKTAFPPSTRRNSSRFRASGSG